VGYPTTIRYDEGAEVGYRWFAKTAGKPLDADAASAALLLREAKQ
jgi:hypothetical protein